MVTSYVRGALQLYEYRYSARLPVKASKLPSNLQPPSRRTGTYAWIWIEAEQSDTRTATTAVSQITDRCPSVLVYY